MRSITLISVLAAAVTTAPAVAQSDVVSAREPAAGAIFHGQILDSISGDPIEGVMVRMDSGESTLSDGLGRFTFSGLEQGRRLFALLTADCRVTWAEITVVNGIPRNERYRLPPAFGAVADEKEEIVEQRTRTSGRVMEQEEIDGAGASTVLELIRRLAPGMVSPMQGDPGNISSLTSSRSRSTGAATDAPVVVIDGVRTPGVEGTLSTMRPNEISRIEVQPGAAAGWEYGSSGASGVIKITMRRGIADGQADRLERMTCMVPEFPRG